MNISPLINQLIEALCCLPGVGPKTAQRMVLHLLERDRDGGLRLAQSLKSAMEGIGRCERCRNLTEKRVCEICDSAARDGSILCVVENPGDVMAIEQTAGYRGLYFVLLGHLSPIDGVGPEEIGVEQLVARITHEDIGEVILATSSTVEGEATAHYLSERLRESGVTISRIAHGIPFGGELEYVDGGTLAHALAGRRQL